MKKKTEVKWRAVKSNDANKMCSSGKSSQWLKHGSKRHTLEQTGTVPGNWRATDDQQCDLGMITRLLLQRRLKYKLQGRKLVLITPQEYGMIKLYQRSQTFLCTRYLLSYLEIRKQSKLWGHLESCLDTTPTTWATLGKFLNWAFLLSFHVQITM